MKQCSLESELFKSLQLPYKRVSLGVFFCFLKSEIRHQRGQVGCWLPDTSLGDSTPCVFPRILHWGTVCRHSSPASLLRAHCWGYTRESKIEQEVAEVGRIQELSVLVLLCSREKLWMAGVLPLGRAQPTHNAPVASWWTCPREGGECFRAMSKMPTKNLAIHTGEVQGGLCAGQDSPCAGLAHLVMCGFSIYL